MKYNCLTILLLIISFAIADIPDVTLSWDTFFIIKIDDIENITNSILSDLINPQIVIAENTSLNDKISISIEDSACNLEINSIIELENSNILLTGTSIGLNSRGVNICFDSSGVELWRRTYWYLDFTSFQNALEKPNGNYLITGWTASENEETFGPGEMNVLLVEINDSGELITGIEIQNSTGSQQPLVTFSISDKIIVIGENSSLESGETEFFLGIIKFPE